MTDRIIVGIESARPATKHYTWQANAPYGLWTVANVNELLRLACEDGVPDDATLQLSDKMYLHWTRPA